MADRETGRLYVVATPIGNLADMTGRAVATLRSVALIACEDTRRAGRLMQQLGIEARGLLALHDHSERDVVAPVIARLEAGDDVALISDAGTPLVSDPGFVLVRAAWEGGIRVTPIPGASAVTAAVSVSPIPAGRFRFEGFLPSRRGQRDAALRRLLVSDLAVVFFESPRRIRATLAAMAALGGGERRILICRELTKLHESLEAGTVSDLAAAPERVPERGEFLCVLAAAEAAPPLAGDDALLGVLAEELPPAQAARIAARLTGRPRAELYAMAAALRDRG